MISIGLPIVKTEFLREAIDNVLNQTYKDFELIILNNGNTADDRNNIRKIVENYPDERIEYYENDSQLQIIKNWNKCFSHSKGEYFVLLCDDDLYEKDFLEEMIFLANKFKNVNIFHCRVRIIDEKGNTINFSPLCPEYESNINFIWHRILGYRLQFISDFMFRTRRLKEVGGFFEIPLAWGSDDITAFLICGENGIAFTQKPLMSFRKSIYNLSTVGDLEMRINALNLYYKWILNYIDKIEPENIVEKELLEQIKERYPEKLNKQINQLLNISSQNEKLFPFFLKLLRYYRNFGINRKVIYRILKHKIKKTIF